MCVASIRTTVWNIWRPSIKPRKPAESMNSTVDRSSRISEWSSLSRRRSSSGGPRPRTPPAPLRPPADVDRPSAARHQPSSSRPCRGSSARLPLAPSLALAVGSTVLGTARSGRALLHRTPSWVGPHTSPRVMPRSRRICRGFWPLPTARPRKRSPSREVQSHRRCSPRWPEVGRSPNLRPTRAAL